MRTPDAHRAYRRPRRLPAVMAMLGVAALVSSACADAGDEQQDAGADAPDRGVPEEPAEGSDTDTSDGEEPARVHEFSVFFTNLDRGEEGEVFAVPRTATTTDPPTSAIAALLEGPTDEEQQEGFSSWFAGDTADVPFTVRVDEGVAHADFAGDLATLIPGASTSAGSLILLAELDATLEQFDDVQSTEYSLDGDVTAFYEWLQLVPPEDWDTVGGGTSGTAARGADTTVVEVFFSPPDSAADTVVGVERVVEVPRVLTGALDALFEGPSDAEVEEGYTSWFSSDTAGLLRSVHLEDTTAHVDIDGELPDVIPNASTSTGSSLLLAALDATATQFPTVDDAIYSLDGDVEAFYTWLQRSAPA